MHSFYSSRTIYIFFSIQQLKLKYYKLMIELDEHELNYLDVCRHYRHMAQTPIVRADKEQLQNVSLDTVRRACT
jgi:hypothetical protein